MQVYIKLTFLLGAALGFSEKKPVKALKKCETVVFWRWIYMRKTLAFTFALLGAASAAADEIISVAQLRDEFIGFLSRPTVTTRALDGITGLLNVRYALTRGQRIDGGCRYTATQWSDIVTEGPVILAREIAHDTSTCERLFMLGNPSPDASINLPTGMSANTSSAASNRVSACQGVQSIWTDGNQPMMKLLRQNGVTAGIQVASAEAWVGYDGGAPSLVPQCTVDVRAGANASGSSAAKAGGLPLVAWTMTEIGHRCTYTDGQGWVCLEQCSTSYDYRFSAGVHATVENTSSIPLVFDCSAGARIAFKDVGVRSLNVYGTMAERWEIKKDVEVTGPVKLCTENLYEDENIYVSCTYSQ